MQGDGRWKLNDEETPVAMDEEETPVAMDDAQIVLPGPHYSKEATDYQDMLRGWAANEDKTFECPVVLARVFQASENVLLSSLHPEVCKWIEAEANLRTNVTWRRILKTHMIRSKYLGGPIWNGNLADAITFESLPSGEVKAQLWLPNSFEPDDGAACGARVVALDKNEATESVCKAVVIELILADALYNLPAKMVLVPNN
jgi:hypothetical protein